MRLFDLPPPLSYCKGENTQGDCRSLQTWKLTTGGQPHTEKRIIKQGIKRGGPFHSGKNFPFSHTGRGDENKKGCTIIGVCSQRHDRQEARRTYHNNTAQGGRFQQVVERGQGMTREDARETIRREWRQILAGMTGKAQEKVNGEDSYICPLCGHGTHGDGLTYDPQSRDRNGLKCFGCGFSGDIIDLYQQHNGIDFNTALKALAIENGIDIERESAQADFSRADSKETTPQGESAQRPVLKRGRAYYEQCVQALA